MSWTTEDGRMGWKRLGCLTECLLKKDSPGCQLIDSRTCYLRVTVATQMISSERINGDNDEVRLGLPRTGGNGKPDDNGSTSYDESPDLQSWLHSGAHLNHNLP